VISHGVKKWEVDSFDIADVRYSYPREDILIVDFKYRIDEQLEGQYSMITVEMPRRYTDNYSGGNFSLEDVEELAYGMYFFTRKSTGEGQIVFKMTLQGSCIADGLQFKISPFFYSTYLLPPELTHEEYVLQPYQITRSFPTMNFDMIRIVNFRFEPSDNWSGVLSFDYQISEGIPIPLEEYRFEVSDNGGKIGCSYSTQGSVVTEHNGTYPFQIELAQDINSGTRHCLSTYTDYTYSNTYLYMYDELANSQVLRMPINYSYTLWNDY